MMRVVVFGDTYGLPMLLRQLPRESIIAVVGASTRPQYIDPLNQISLSLGVPCLIQPKISEGVYHDFIEGVRYLGPDFLIVNSYAMKLRRELLEIPIRGAVNIHGGLLPQYRGCNPIQYAILNGEDETGVTMHFMDDNFDTGDIIAQQRVPIFFSDSWLDVRDRLTEATEHLLSLEIPKLFSGTNSRHPQQDSQAHYYKRRYPADGEIHWHERGCHIYNLIRALVKPHPGAFYFYKGEKIVLDEYHQLSDVLQMKYGIIGRQCLESNETILDILTLEDYYKYYYYNKSIDRNIIEYLTSINKQFDNNCIKEKVFIGIWLKPKNKNIFIAVARIFDINYILRTCSIDIYFNEDKNITDNHIREAIKIIMYVVFTDLNLCKTLVGVPRINGKGIKELILMGCSEINSMNNIDIITFEMLSKNYAP